MVLVRLSVNWTFPEMVVPNPVLPDVGNGAVGEIEGREGIGRGMRGDAYRMIEDQPELGNGRGPLDGESVIFVVIGEPETEFVQQRRSNRIVVGNHQAAVLFVGSVIGQKIVCGGNDAGVVELAYRTRS